MIGEENIWILFNPALMFKIYSNDHWGKREEVEKKLWKPEWMLEEVHCFELCLHAFSRKQFSIFLLEPGSENRSEMFILSLLTAKFPKVHPWCNPSDTFS